MPAPAQADRMKARSATATMARRADRMPAGLEPRRRAEKTARIRLPEPAPCGRTPLGAISLATSYGGHRVLAGVDLAVGRGGRLVVLGLNGAGKTTLPRIPAGAERPDAGRVVHGHAPRLGRFAQEHDTLDPRRTVLENLALAAPHLTPGEARRVLGACLFTGDDADKPAACCRAARRPGRHWPAWSTPGRTCCCCTSRPTTSTRTPAPRCWTRSARIPARS
ncbi:hypothetical protein GCM10010236_34870 [Streptomyces eurythermus]|nr:hypothetical protein GCM10010236_34870 [Streptomyces eurythermus]